MFETLGAGWGRFTGATLRAAGARGAGFAPRRRGRGATRGEPRSSPRRWWSRWRACVRLLATVRAELPCARERTGRRMHGRRWRPRDLDRDGGAPGADGAARGRGRARRGDGTARARRRGRYAPVTVTVYNQGKQEIRFTGASAWTMRDVRASAHRTTDDARAGQQRARLDHRLGADAPAMPWWMATPARAVTCSRLPSRIDEQASYLAIGEDRAVRHACDGRAA